jgi:hypothetical protein
MFTSLASNFSGVEGLLIGAAVIVFFVVRQFSTRRIASAANLIVPAALLYFGLQTLDQLDSTRWLLLGLGTSLAIALGAARGLSFQVWTDERGRSLMRGGALTVALWVLTIAVKVAVTFAEINFGFAPGTSTAETLLPAAATIAAQLLVVYLRAQDQRLLSYRVS